MLGNRNWSKSFLVVPKEFLKKEIKRVQLKKYK